MEIANFKEEIKEGSHFKNAYSINNVYWVQLDVVVRAGRHMDIFRAHKRSLILFVSSFCGFVIGDPLERISRSEEEKDSLNISLSLWRDRCSAAFKSRLCVQSNTMENTFPDFVHE